MANKRTQLVAKINWRGEFRVVFEEKNDQMKFVTYRRLWDAGRRTTRKIGEGLTLADQLALVIDTINNEKRV